MKRNYALDIFRGLTIFSMIVVNNPGSWAHIHTPLAHAQWHGWTITDLIFPFFLIIVGISIALSFTSGSKASLSAKSQSKEILFRAIKLYGLGIFLALFYYQFHNPGFQWFEERLLDVRLVGVLQRIALVYLLSALIFLWLPTTWRLPIFIILPLCYWALMLGIPYPLPDGTMAKGMLQPGNNLAAYIDHQIIGPRHLYLENTKPYASDPEGILSSLGAITSCVGGFLIASILLQYQKPIVQIKRLAIWGFITLAIAYILSNWIPINKNLWTPSYVFLAHGFACLCLAMAIFVSANTLIRKFTKPFLVFGMNAIALFMLSGITARLLIMIRVSNISLKDWIYGYFKLLPFAPENQSLVFAFAFMLLMYLPLYWMYHKQIFWKI